MPGLILKVIPMLHEKNFDQYLVHHLFLLLSLILTGKHLLLCCDAY